MKIINKIKKIIVGIFPSLVRRGRGWSSPPRLDVGGGMWWRRQWVLISPPRLGGVRGGRNRRYILAALFIALIVIVLSFVLFRNSQTTEAAWFNDSWHYRMQFDVFNASTTQALTDFQVKIPTSTLTLSTLYTNSKVKSNFNDLRFTDMNGNLLDYWFPDATSTMNAVYVKFPNLPKNATSTIFMYYGNQSADNEKELGNDFFYFYDDFSNNLDKWLAGDGGTWTIESGELSSSGGTFKPADWTGTNYTIEAKAKRMSGSHFGLVIRSIAGERSYYEAELHDASTGGIYYMNPSTYTSISSGSGGSGTVLTGVWYNLLFKASGTALRFEIDGSGVSRWQVATDSNYASGRPGAWSWGEHVHYDNFIVRKYAQTEPIVVATSGTSEEIGGGPIGYWKFDEGYGTTAYDSSSYKNNGTLTNMSTTGTSTAWVTGKVGKALLFDGTNDKVNMGDVLDMDTSDFSVSTWFKTSASGFTGDIVGKRGSGAPGTAPGWGIRITSTGAIGIELDDGTANSKTGNAITPAEYSDNKWHYVVVTFNRDGNATGYIDGKQKQTVNISAVGNVNGTRSLFIGASYGDVYDFKGTIDEVKIYKYLLSASQILTEYNQGKSVILSQTPEQVQNLNEGLVGHWKMDESTTAWDGAGDRVNDYSGNGNNGTAVGTAHATTTAKYGNSGEFDGDSDYVNCGDANSTMIFGNRPHTYEAWVYARSFPNSNNYIIATGNDSTGLQSGLGVNSSGKLFLSAYTSPLVTFSQTQTLSANQWYYITMVYDGTYANIYVNGSFSEKLSISLNTTTGKCRIGSPVTTTYYWNGLIDDVKIYNTARTPDQIMQDYLTGPGPVAYYDFNEGRGTSLSDKSGNGNNSSSFNGGLGGSGDWVKGKYGRALDFDGSNDYIDFGQPDFSKFNDNAFSIGFWMYGLTQSDSLAGIMGKTNTGDFSNNADYKKGWTIFYTGSTSFYLRMSDNDNDDTIDYDSIGLSIADNIKKWTYVVFTIEKGIGSVNLKAYKNGLLTGSAARTIYSSGIVDDSAGNLNFGRWQTYDRNFNGSLDEVKFWNYALTPWQIAQEYNSGKPIAYWDFEEGNGTIAKDKSGNNLNGTLTNMSTTGTSTAWTTGKVGKALMFDGVNDYVTEGNVLNMGTNDFSISAWVKSKSTATYNSNGVVYKRGTAYNYSEGYRLNMPNGQFNFHIADGTNYQSVIVGSAGQYNDGKWHHVVATASRGKELAIYVDGLKNGSASETTVGNIDSTVNLATGALNIGASYYHPFSGAIDEVKIYNYVLAPYQIKKDYNDSKAVVMGTSDGGQQAQQGLVAWYKMDEATTTWDGAGDRVNDYSGNNNTGTAYGHAHATTTAQYGNSAQFDGTDDYVDIPDSVAIGRSLTVIAWVKSIPALWNAHGWIASSRAANGFIIHPNSGSKNVEMFILNSAASYSSIGIVTPADITIWHQYGLIYNFDTKKAYTILDGSINEYALDIARTDDIIPLDIGRDYDYVADRFGQGLIDDVKIYNTARTPDQIMQDYLTGPGPIAYYDFEEGRGTTANDKSGQGHNGTITAGTGGYKKGKIGKAYEFDGTNTKIDTGSDWIGAAGYTTQALSISAWVYADSYVGAGQRSILDNLTLWLYIENGRLRFASSYLGPWLDFGPFSLGQWNHIVITRSSAATNKATAYINGVLSGTADQSSGTPLAGRANVIISGYTKWDGRIDDLKVYNYVLTPWQIAQEYNGGQPIGHWQLDEGEGGTIKDTSGKGYNGTLSLNGSPATSTAWQTSTNCKINGCLDFDGTDDYVNAGDISSIDGAAALTVTAWIKTDNTNEDDDIASKAASHNTNQPLLFWRDDSVGGGDQIGNTDALSILVYDGDTQAWSASPTNSLNNTGWHHVAFTFTANVLAGLKPYVDGVNVNSASTVGVNSIQSSANNFVIGSNDAHTVLFNGKIDDVRVYNYALSPAQISEVYNMGFGTYFK